MCILMEHLDHETYVPAAGSMFFPTDSQLLNLLRPPSQDTAKALDGALDNNENSIMGSMIFDMLSMQFPTGSASPRDRLHVPDHNPKTTSHHVAEEMGASIEEEQVFDPVCFLKLPVLAERGLDQSRFSPSNSQEFASLGPLKNDLAPNATRANAGNNWQEIPCIEYSLPPGRISRTDSEKEEAFAHPDERQNLVQTYIHGKIMRLEHNFSVTEFSSEKFPIERPHVYSDGIPKVLEGSASGFQSQKAKRKRSKTLKNIEEIESQRMIHIAVERNRRKQMNEHLKVLRSLMPGSYVQRGDQASIIGGAIEFVKELEQLLQCLESQKRRRLYSDASKLNTLSNCLPLDAPASQQQIGTYPLPSDANILDSFLQPLTEEVAEVKSPLADIEVKLVGCDAIIKILSERRPRQLLNTIAALENLQFSIFHTNVTTIEHTVLYSFNVKVNVECSSTAEEIATSVQQIFNII